MTQVPRLWRSLGVAQQAQALRLWVSTRGAVTPLHFDAADSFLAQMRGTKRVTFFPPDALAGLYAYPADHPLHRRARVDLYADADERRQVFEFLDGVPVEYHKEYKRCNKIGG